MHEMIPTREECIQLLKEYEVPEPKIGHCMLVENISVTISKLLNEKGEAIDIDIISRASLLHDIAKNEKMRGKDHALLGFQICTEKNIDPRICEIIRNHALESILQDGLKTMEEKIVFYADKICKYEIIGIDARFAPWENRDPNKELFIAKEKTLQLEKEILNKLNMTPEEILTKLRIIINQIN
jgi:putative nucleotidyltransferase with HDIG domain